METYRIGCGFQGRRNTAAVVVDAGWTVVSDMQRDDESNDLFAHEFRKKEILWDLGACSDLDTTVGVHASRLRAVLSW